MMARCFQLLKEKLSEARSYVRLEEENHLTKEVTTIINISKCAAIKASSWKSWLLANEFCWDGEEMAILSEMFKQTAQQLAAEQNTASQLVMRLKTCWNNFANDHCHKRVVSSKTCAVISVITRFETICTIEVDFFQTYGVHYFKKVEKRNRPYCSLKKGQELIRQLLFKTNDSNNSSLTLFFYERQGFVYLRGYTRADTKIGG